MKILAIDTTTEACSVALLQDGETRERFELAPRKHAELVLPWIESLLAEAQLRIADLDVLASTRGPGSFTGVRIGVGVAQGLAFGAGLGVLGVSTLQALALEAHSAAGTAGVLAALDARMGEIYTAAFDFASEETGRALNEERVCVPERIDVPAPGLCGAGSGFSSYPQLSGQVTAVVEDAWPHAAQVAAIAAALLRSGAQPLAPEDFQPVYLRNRVAEKPGRVPGS